MASLKSKWRGYDDFGAPRDGASPNSLTHSLTQTREHHDGRQGLAISHDLQHHYLVPNLQTGRQEEIYGGSARREKKTRGCCDRKQGLTISRDPAPLSGSQVTRSETRGDYDGRQELAIFRDPRHHHPAPKLQEGRQEEIMMGDKNLGVPATKGTTIRLPSYTSYKKGDKRRQDLAISRDRHNYNYEFFSTNLEPLQ